MHLLVTRRFNSRRKPTTLQNVTPREFTSSGLFIYAGTMTEISASSVPWLRSHFPHGTTRGLREETTVPYINLLALRLVYASCRFQRFTPMAARVLMRVHSSPDTKTEIFFSSTQLTEQTFFTQPLTPFKISTACFKSRLAKGILL